MHATIPPNVGWMLFVRGVEAFSVILVMAALVPPLWSLTSEQP